MKNEAKLNADTVKAKKSTKDTLKTIFLKDNQIKSSLIKDLINHNLVSCFAVHICLHHSGKMSMVKKRFKLI